MPWKPRIWQLPPRHTLPVSPPPQATFSPSPPISAQATMDGVAAFCATHSPQLTPLSAGIIVCCERSEGKTKECCWQGQELLGKAWGLGPSPEHPLEPLGSSSKTLSGIFCVPVIPIQSWQGKGVSGEEDTEKWSHFDLAKLEETLMQ